MADVSILWRLVDEPNSTGYESGRIGDILVITTADHIYNSKERTEYGVAIITDIPADKLEAAQERLQRGIHRFKLIKDLGDGTFLCTLRTQEHWFANQYNISLAKCIVQWPALENDLTNKLFNPEFEITQAAIPSLTWTKFKAVFWDRVNEEFIADMEA